MRWKCGIFKFPALLSQLVFREAETTNVTILLCPLASFCYVTQFDSCLLSYLIIVWNSSDAGAFQSTRANTNDNKTCQLLLLTGHVLYTCFVENCGNIVYTSVPVNIVNTVKYQTRGRDNELRPGRLLFIKYN